MSFRELISIIVLLSASPAIFGQGLPVARPEEAGMSSDSLALIRTAMKRYIREDKLPGIVTMVARHREDRSF